MTSTEQFAFSACVFYFPVGEAANDTETVKVCLVLFCILVCKNVGISPENLKRALRAVRERGNIFLILAV